MTYNISKDKSLEINYKLTDDQAIAFIKEFDTERPKRRTLKGVKFLHCLRVDYGKFSWASGRTIKEIYSIKFQRNHYWFATEEIAKMVMKAIMMKEDGVMPTYGELGNS